MQLKDVLKNLNRPKILLTAAKLSLKSYSRDKTLKKLIGTRKTLKPSQAIRVLLNYENELEGARNAKARPMI